MNKCPMCNSIDHTEAIFNAVDKILLLPIPRRQPKKNGVSAVIRKARNKDRNHLQKEWADYKRWFKQWNNFK